MRGNKNFYVSISEVKEFYFRFILFLFLKDEYYRNEYSLDNSPIVNKDNMFLLTNNHTEKNEIIVFFNYVVMSI